MPGWIVTKHINTVILIARPGYNQGPHVCCQIQRLIIMDHILAACHLTSPTNIDDVCAVHGSIENAFIPVANSPVK